MLQEPGRLGGDPPLIGIGKCSPRVQASAKAVDDLHQLVLLALGFELLPFFVEAEFLLDLSLGARDRAQERRHSPLVDEMAGRLPRFVEFPVACRERVGRVEDRLVEELAGHVDAQLSFRWLIVVPVLRPSTAGSLRRWVPAPLPCAGSASAFV